jgi:peptide deformylase
MDNILARRISARQCSPAFAAQTAQTLTNEVRRNTIRKRRLYGRRRDEMAVMRIVTVSDEDSAVLHTAANRVRVFGPELHSILDDMIETMREAPGVGLAAPQVGVGLRVAVIEYPEDEDDPENTLRVFEIINPEIVKSKGVETAQEGCLSIPGMAADVERASFVVVSAQDRYGKEFRIKAYDWLARIFQHEIDHLHGVLMTDKAIKVYRLEKNEEGVFEAVPIETGEPVS